MTKVEVLGINFDNRTFEQFQNEFKKRLMAHQSTFIVTANPEIVMVAQENTEFKKILTEKADYITADGIGIVKAAQMLKTPLSQRVTGYDLFSWFMEFAQEKQLKVYLIGAKSNIIHEVQKKVARQFPQIKLVGAEDGYFKDNLSVVSRRIMKTKPDLVFAALGSPRQEKLLAILRENELPAVMMGVGGSFDVFSGLVKRAPVIWQNLHIEWLYRLLTNPRRFRRMLILPKFVLQVKKSRKEKN